VDQGQFSDPDFISGTHERENVQFADKLEYHIALFLGLSYDITDENNNISSDGLDRYYHKYPSSSYQTHRDISDNVCLDLQNCHYSIFIDTYLKEHRLIP
jgi:hypothetical protein